MITGLECLVAFPHRPCSTATAAGVPRSSFIAAMNSSGTSGGLLPPARSVARSTKLSMRPSAATDSAMAASSTRSASGSANQAQPYRTCRESLDHFRDKCTVVQRLAHLLPGSGHQRVVHPVRAKRCPAAGLEPARSRGEGNEDQDHHHGYRTHRPGTCWPWPSTQMPTRPASPPRGRPTGRLGLVVLVALPQREVLGSLFPRGSESAAGSMSSMFCGTASRTPARTTSK